MDKTPYSDFLLCMQTIRLCRRIMRNNPELWEQICREAAQVEAEAVVRAFARRHPELLCPDSALNTEGEKQNES